MFSREREVIAYGYGFSVGEIAGKPVVVVVCGIGEETASTAVLGMSILFNIEWGVNIGRRSILFEAGRMFESVRYGKVLTQDLYTLRN